MSSRRFGGHLRSVFTVAVLSLSVLSVLTAVAPAHAAVTEVHGSAFGYFTDVSLFGGPSKRYGYGQPADAPQTAASPSVSCPESASVTDPDGARGVYGPATIFGGKSVAGNGVNDPPSGPLTATTDCQADSVTASSSVTLMPPGSTWIPYENAPPEPHHGGVGPGPFTADGVSSACASSETATTASTTITGGQLVLSDSDVVALPENPAPGTEYYGVIEGVGDHFRVVLNEQVVTSDSITVNAVHMYLLGPVAVGEMVIAQSHCDVVATSANQAPTAADDTYGADSFRLDVPAPGVLANDSDPDGDPLTAQMHTDPVVSSFPANGELTLNSDGSFTYIADHNFGGTDTFTYLVRDPRGGSDTATVTITVAPPPTELLNDNFADAQTITGRSGTVRAPDNVDATVENGEPLHAGFAGYRSIWYRWTAPVDGEATVDTCGSSELFAVDAYTGDAVDALTPAGTIYNDLCGPGSRGTFRITAGTVYYIALANFDENTSGTSTLNWSTVAAPPNDDFADAEVLSGPSGEVLGSNRAATNDEGYFGDNTIWYQWTAPDDAVVAFDTCHTDIRDDFGNPSGHQFAAYTGDSVATLTEVILQDNYGAYPIIPDCPTEHQTLVFRTTAGTVYHLAFSSYVEGRAFLTWETLPQAPNDDFADAQIISGPSGSVTGSNGPESVATSELGEPFHANNDPQYAIWYRWTAPGDGEVTFETCDSAIDTILAVYTGSSVDALSEVASNDDGCPSGGGSRVTFVASAGMTYHIATGSNYLAQVGALTLAWNQTPPTPDLAVEISDSPDPARVRARVTYTVTVTNDGGSTATGVILAATPRGATVVSATGATCTVQRGRFKGTTCQGALGDLASGASATVTIVVKAPPKPGVVRLTATADANENDLNPANNTSSNETTIVR